MAVIGQRFEKQPSDVNKSWKDIPMMVHKDFDSFFESMPYSCVLVGVELTDQSKNLTTFSHLERAIYLLGAEDHGLPEKILQKCHALIQVDLTPCLNVAVIGSIVMYDRYLKRIEK